VLKLFSEETSTIYSIGAINHNDDFTTIDLIQDDLMVITVESGNFAITKTLVDQESSVDNIYWKTLKNIRIPETEIQLYDNQIVGFLRERVDTLSYIDLYTTFDEYLCRTMKIRYLIVDANTSCNILLEWLSINHLREIVSTLHLAMKFPSASGNIVTVHVDEKVAEECCVVSLKVEPTN